MTHFVINNHLGEDEKFKELLDLINKTDSNICFLIECGGGSMTYAGFLVDLINENPSRFQLYGSFMYSAAFYLFYFAKCKKKLYHAALGMFHLPYRRFEIISNGKAYYEQDQAHIKNDQEHNHNYIVEVCKAFMTEEEIKKMQEPNDVFFTFNRMKEIFPDIEVF